MDFGLSEEQRLLEATLRRYLEEAAPTTRVREIVATESGHEASLWEGLAELGVTGILIPESFGGSELGLLDAVVAAQSLAWAATPAPFLATAVMAPTALMTAGSSAQQAEWLPRIATGKTCFGVAATELFSRREGAGVQLIGQELVGDALFVVDAGSADAFLVAVEPESLALVPRDTKGLALELLHTVDRTRRIGELHFDGVRPAEWIGGPEGAEAAIERMLDAGRVALAADILGACDRAITMAVDYAQQRQQFGRVIGSFQAVKHMCAEMAAEIEPARSLLWYAAHAFDALPNEASLMACHAKAHLAEIGTEVVKTATEVHGGIGFTYEHDLHLWFKRVGLDRQLLGSPQILRARAAGLQGWGTPSPSLRDGPRDSGSSLPPGPGDPKPA
jgi:alkylation response protein AidB-like acyl-CoA dehydrogenase